MKHTKKKKLLAFVLCMVLVLSTAMITAFAVDGNFYYVPKDTVELSHEIMKDGDIAGNFICDRTGRHIQVKYRQCRAADGYAGRDIRVYGTGSCSDRTGEYRQYRIYCSSGSYGRCFSSGSAQKIKHRFPEKAVNFRFENTSLDTAHAMGFVYDSSDETITLYELKEDTLQFEEDVKLETETVVVGCFDVD